MTLDVSIGWGWKLQGWRFWKINKFGSAELACLSGPRNTILLMPDHLSCIVGKVGTRENDAWNKIVDSFGSAASLFIFSLSKLCTVSQATSLKRGLFHVLLWEMCFEKKESAFIETFLQNTPLTSISRQRGAGSRSFHTRERRQEHHRWARELQRRESDCENAGAGLCWDQVNRLYKSKLELPQSSRRPSVYEERSVFSKYEDMARCHGC